MKRSVPIFLILLAALLVAALPADAQRGRRGYRGDDAFRFFGGVLEPDGDSAYWADKELDFTGKAEDFEDIVLGIDYVRALGDRLDLVVSASAFEGDATQSYIDFVDSRGAPIRHDTFLETATFTAGLSFNLLPRGAAVVPYVGAGGGLYAWTLTEDGEFIDFAPGADLEIFPAVFEDDGVAFGWYFSAGLEVPLGPSLSIFAQGRWHNVDDELEGDFVDLGELDLSGRELTAGISWRF